MKVAIAVFCCDRPLHLENLISSLYPIGGLDSQSVNFFCDKYRSSDRASDWGDTQRLIQKTISCHGGNAFFSDENQGLAKSISSGVSKILESYDAVIVLEDDLILHRHFIDYQLTALEKYKNSKEVYQISGFSLKIPPPQKNTCYFLPSVSTWGWATWRRAWEGFSLENIRCECPTLPFLERQAFDYFGAYTYSQMLESSIAGRNSSWGVLWNWHVFKNRGLVLYPPKSLVYNAGFDGSGVHCKQLSSDHWQWTLQEMNSAGDLKKFAFPISKLSLSSQISRQADALIKIRMRDVKGLKNRLRYFYLRLRFRVIRLLLSPFLCISR
jgi:hypothetical protein